ncbi:tRNA N(3)-methylcytidine methyltransferase METTL6 [Pseudoscourfieldia marina]
MAAPSSSSSSSSSSRLAPHQVARLEANAHRAWDCFYKSNGNKFFKDRHWLLEEFHTLTPDAHHKLTLVEMGCGTGATVYPVLEARNAACATSTAVVHACDYAPTAVKVLKKHAAYEEANINAFVCNVAKEDIVACGAPRLAEESADVATMIFALSAMSPDTFAHALEQARRVLKVGGTLLIRDYAEGDMAMERLAGKKGGMDGIREIDERFYMRGDGTRAYYFQVDELRSLLTTGGFDVASCSLVSMRNENRAQELIMDRRFVQARAVKV